MLRIATLNVNGVRAAFRKGMNEWLTTRGVDILALQEVRAETENLVALLGEGWQVLHDAASAKGRAGVALVSRIIAEDHRTRFGPDDFDSSGRWLEADYRVGDTLITVVSCYVNSGEVGTPKQIDKYRFLDALVARLPTLAADNPLTLVAGDLNVGHRTLDIKNWRGNTKRSGFLAEERAYFDRILGEETAANYNAGSGLGWVDLGRRLSGEVPGPYTWWSQRGQAFDNDTGWRIDYHLSTPALAEKATNYTVDRYPSYAARFSDHAPVVIDYRLSET